MMRCPRSMHVPSVQLLTFHPLISPSLKAAALGVEVTRSAENKSMVKAKVANDVQRHLGLRCGDADAIIVLGNTHSFSLVVFTLFASPDKYGEIVRAQPYVISHH